MAGILFEDIFDVKDIDPEGKKFDRGELEPSCSHPLFPEPLLSFGPPSGPGADVGGGTGVGAAGSNRGLTVADRPALPSVSPALRERVLQDGPHPGRQHPDLPRGPRYAAGMGSRGVGRREEGGPACCVRAVRGVGLSLRRRGAWCWRCAGAELCSGSLLCGLCVESVLARPLEMPLGKTVSANGTRALWRAFEMGFSG